MKKILVIEREFNTVNSITSFCEALGIETVVVHNWPSKVKSLKPNDLLLIFINVEMRSVHIDKLFETFEQGGEESVPIVYLYSRTYDPRFVKAKEYPYFADIKKPIPLNEVFSILSSRIDLESFLPKDVDAHTRLTEYKKFYKDMTEWVTTLGIILSKQASDEN